MRKNTWRPISHVIKILGNKPITIRTVDLGADKRLEREARTPR